MSLRKHLPSPVKRVVRGVRRRLPTPPPTAIELPPRPPVPRTPVRLLVGPANFAGQGHLWARAAETLPGVGATSFATVKGTLDFPCDYGVPVAIYRDRYWQEDQRRFVLAHYTHVLVEAERPIFGTLYASEVPPEIPVMRRAGLRVGLIAHGSDVRIPSRHAESHVWSPFRDADDWESLPVLERQASRNAAFLAAYDGPVFVSTPDLLDDVPKATWCPVVVDLDAWATEVPILQRPVPVVVHAPSHSRIKGSDLVDPVLTALAAAGRVDYLRIEGVDPSQMPAAYRDADIVLDQFRLGAYGVAACEAMAAGRVVLAHVTDEVRERVRAHTGHVLPVVEATGDTLAATIERLIADPEGTREVARQSAAFVRDVHDGRRSAAALAGFLTPGAS